MPNLNISVLDIQANRERAKRQKVEKEKFVKSALFLGAQRCTRVAESHLMEEEATLSNINESILYHLMIKKFESDETLKQIDLKNLSNTTLKLIRMVAAQIQKQFQTFKQITSTTNYKFDVYRFISRYSQYLNKKSKEMET